MIHFRISSFFNNYCLEKTTKTHIFPTLKLSNQKRWIEITLYNEDIMHKKHLNLSTIHTQTQLILIQI